MIQNVLQNIFNNEHSLKKILREAIVFEKMPILQVFTNKDYTNLE